MKDATAAPNSFKRNDHTNNVTKINLCFINHIPSPIFSGNEMDKQDATDASWNIMFTTDGIVKNEEHNDCIQIQFRFECILSD